MTTQQPGKDRPSTLLGDGRGIDHVIIYVWDLETAKPSYRDLGFVVAPRGEGNTQLPSGFVLSEAFFPETFQSLEWRAIDDRELARRERPRIVSFLEQHTLRPSSSGRGRGQVLN